MSLTSVKMHARAGLLGVCLTFLAPHILPAQPLDGRLEVLLADTKLGSAKTGVVIIDAGDGAVLAAHLPDEPLIPASNMKLVTTGAALSVLGRDFSFQTELVYDPEFRPAGSEASGAAPGRVILRGSGDPALADPKLMAEMKLTVEGLLDAWSAALKGAGVGRPAELVIDDRVFDREFVHPTWPVVQLNRWYCAEVAGVNFHTNLLMIYTDPREAGRPPEIKTEPAAPWLEIRNKARSVKDGNHTAWAARDPSGNGLTLHGDVRFGNDPIEVALSDNPTFIGQLLANRMGLAGMAPATVRLAALEEDLSRGRVVHVVRTDLATALRRCNVDSYNLYAECFLKRIGHEVTRAPGSWSNGSAVVRMVLLDRLGPAAGQAFQVADGSGMSRENRVTARMLAQWLASLAGDSKISEDFLASLPQAKVDGTLRKRFRDGDLVNEVRAKTGYLTGVSSMSGYITDPASRRRLVFSIITNDKPARVPTAIVHEVQEKIVRMADSWLAAQTGAKRTVRPGG